ncbi:MAG: nucleotidyltransferase family protein [Pseudomonadota bacterium]|jgi:molybdenum cofactor cytidylyltransferase
MGTFSAVLLAAGESRRMGNANKLLLPLEGRPLVARTLSTLSSCRFEEIVVVLGHESDILARAVRPWCEQKAPRVSVVVNADYREGQMTSVTCGVRRLVRPVDGILVCPGDMPLITPSDIQALLHASEMRQASILIPTYCGQRGNPVVISYLHRNEIVAHRNLGCKYLIARNPDLVATFETGNAHCITDMDTPEDYASVAAALESNVPV